MFTEKHHKDLCATMDISMENYSTQRWTHMPWMKVIYKINWKLNIYKWFGDIFMPHHVMVFFTRLPDKTKSSLSISQG